MKPEENQKHPFDSGSDEILWFEDTCIDDPAEWKAVAEERARDPHRRRRSLDNGSPDSERSTP
jgi:hypothetical protein